MNLARSLTRVPFVIVAVLSLLVVPLAVVILKVAGSIRPLAFARLLHLRAVSRRGWLRRSHTVGGIGVTSLIYPLAPFASIF